MNPLIVTALYDIGRSEWKDYNMSYDTYLTWMENTLNLKCKMVIFTEEKFEKRIRYNRSKTDLDGSMTEYIIKPLDQLESYKKWNKSLTELMNSEIFKKKRQWEKVPEMNYPLYNIIMFNKVHFLKQASEIDTVSSHLIWLDAGGIRDKSEIIYENNWPNLNKLVSDKIMHFSHNIQFSIPNLEWYSFSQFRNIQGGGFICPSSMIDWYVNEINKTIEDSISNGYIGSDEKIFDITYIRNPDKFVLVKLGWREYYSYLVN